MSFKAAPQILGLVRGIPKNKQKHRANGKKIVGEMGKYKKDSDERYSKSITYDSTRSHLNRYEGFDNGYAAWDELCDRAERYRTIGTTKNGKKYARPLRHDAVVGFSVIFNPPEEVCKDWSDDEYERFYQDSWSVLCEIESRVFSDKNIIMKAEHFDEGIPPFGERDRHIHIFGETKDSDGKYCGNFIDAKFFAKLNQEYPQKMRERGWDIEDLDVTDWKKFNNTPDENGIRPYTDEEVRAYRKERKNLWRKSGRDVTKYVLNKAQENNAKALNELETAFKVKTVLTENIERFETEKEEWDQDKKDFEEKAAAEVQRINQSAEEMLRQATLDADNIRINAANQADSVYQDARRQGHMDGRDEGRKEIHEELSDKKYEIESTLLQVKNAIKMSKEQIPDNDMLDFIKAYKIKNKDGEVISLYDIYEQWQERRDEGRRIVSDLVTKGEQILDNTQDKIDDLGGINSNNKRK